MSVFETCCSCVAYIVMYFWVYQLPIKKSAALAIYHCQTWNCALSSAIKKLDRVTY